MQLKKYLQKKYKYGAFDIVNPEIIKAELLLSEVKYQEIRSEHNGLFEFRDVCKIIEDNL